MVLAFGASTTIKGAAKQIFGNLFSPSSIAFNTAIEGVDVLYFNQNFDLGDYLEGYIPIKATFDAFGDTMFITRPDMPIKAKVVK